MITEKQARDLADKWIEAWNSHDLDAILSHYDEDVMLTSPVAQKIMEAPNGTVKGKTALKDYFTKGLEIHSDLRFELLDVMWGMNSVVVHYRNQKGVAAAEFMELGPTGQVMKVVANYSC